MLLYNMFYILQGAVMMGMAMVMPFLMGMAVVILRFMKMAVVMPMTVHHFMAIFVFMHVGVVIIMDVVMLTVIFVRMLMFVVMVVTFFFLPIYPYRNMRPRNSAFHRYFSFNLHAWYPQRI